MRLYSTQCLKYSIQVWASALGSAGVGLIFTSSGLGWPKQPIKWDIRYHV